MPEIQAEPVGVADLTPLFNAVGILASVEDSEPPINHEDRAAWFTRLMGSRAVVVHEAQKLCSGLLATHIDPRRQQDARSGPRTVPGTEARSCRQPRQRPGAGPLPALFASSGACRPASRALVTAWWRVRLTLAPLKGACLQVLSSTTETPTGSPRVLGLVTFDRDNITCGPCLVRHELTPTRKGL